MQTLTVWPVSLATRMDPHILLLRSRHKAGPHSPFPPRATVSTARRATHDLLFKAGLASLLGTSRAWAIRSLYPHSLPRTAQAVKATKATRPTAHRRRAVTQVQTSDCHMCDGQKRKTPSFVLLSRSMDKDGNLLPDQWALAAIISAGRGICSCEEKRLLPARMAVTTVRMVNMPLLRRQQARRQEVYLVFPFACTLSVITYSTS